jgi:hypothetical protein
MSTIDSLLQDVKHAKSDTARLLIASLLIDQFQKDRAMTAEAIKALSADNRLLRARLRLADLKLERTKWPISDLNAEVRT